MLTSFDAAKAESVGTRRGEGLPTHVRSPLGPTALSSRTSTSEGSCARTTPWDVGADDRHRRRRPPGARRPEQRRDHVVAATALGLAESLDAGETWRFVIDGLHAEYARAVALDGEHLFMSASVGPRGGRAALYRRTGDAAGFAKCTGGLPEWFGQNIDSHHLAAAVADASCSVPRTGCSPPRTAASRGTMRAPPIPRSRVSRSARRPRRPERTPGTVDSAPVAELKGFFPPRSPEGKASLVPAPPWHYSGDVLTIEYRTDPDRVGALLPEGVSPPTTIPAPSRSSGRTGSRAATPARSCSTPSGPSTRNASSSSAAGTRGETYSRCVYIWVDKDFALARGWYQGYPKKLGSIWMTRPVTVGRAGPSARRRRRVRGFAPGQRPAPRRGPADAYRGVGDRRAS